MKQVVFYSVYFLTAGAIIGFFAFCIGLGFRISGVFR